MTHTDLNLTPTRLCALFLMMIVWGATTETQADEANWALSFGVGANYSARSDLEGVDTEVDYDLGLPRWHGGIARRLGERWWLGAELAQRKTKAEFIIPPGNSPSLDPASNDKFTSADFLLSISREFSFGPWLKPYLKFGAGPTWIDYRLNEQGLGGVEPIPLIDDKATTFALQGTAGLKIPLSRSLDLSVAYEYWRAPDIELEDVNGAGIDLDQTMHSGWLDLTYYPGAGRTTGFAASRATGAAPGGFYLAGGIGVGWVRDSETATVAFDAFSPGSLYSLAFGRTIGRRWRAEIEYAYRGNDAELVDYGPYVGEERVDGVFSTSSFALNVHYELFPDAPVRPSLGVGAGTTSLRYDLTFHDDGSPFIDDNADTSFWQLLVGLNVEVSRRVTLSTGWRMWQSSKVDLEFSDGSRESADNWVHSAELTLRYSLAGG